MIEHGPCTAPRDPGTIGGPRCGAPGKYYSVLGWRCGPCWTELQLLTSRGENLLGQIVQAFRKGYQRRIAQLKGKP